MALYTDNLYTMRAAVKQVKPNCSPESIDRFLNKRIRDVATKRYWSDLLRYDFIAIPALYNTGTITTTAGSTIVNGTGTGWPVADEVNANSAASLVKVPGIQTIKPSSMTGIKAGQYLLVDAGNNPEAVAVIDTSASTFAANFTRTHDAGFTITKSSLAGRQIRVTYSMYDIVAVVDATTIWLAQAWSEPAVTGSPYRIVQAYIQPHPQAWRIHYAWDPVQGIALDVDSLTLREILISDPQLTTTDNPTVIVNMPPGPGGVGRWFLYPVQTAARQIGMVYSVLPPAMGVDQDRAPAFINPECFVAGAIADALRTRSLTQDSRTDPYFDRELANDYELQYRDYVAQAEDADEARSNTRLQNYRITVAGGFSAAYMQSHVGSWPSDWSV